jgi:hypothetical protein
VSVILGLDALGRALSRPQVLLAAVFPAVVGIAASETIEALFPKAFPSLMPGHGYVLFFLNGLIVTCVQRYLIFQFSAEGQDEDGAAGAGEPSRGRACPSDAPHYIMHGRTPMQFNGGRLNVPAATARRDGRHQPEVDGADHGRLGRRGARARLHALEEADGPRPPPPPPPPPRDWHPRELLLGLKKHRSATVDPCGECSSDRHNEPPIIGGSLIAMLR